MHDMTPKLIHLDQKNGIERWAVPAIQVISASILLSLASQIAIPLPLSIAPLTLQTVMVFLIALTLGAKRGTAAIGFYLIQATFGLPVFTGGMSNALWYLGPRAGYLVGYMIAAWIIGKLAEEERERSYFEFFLMLFMGEATILISGALWLSLFVGLPNAVGMGVIPFLVGDSLKIALTLSITKPISRFLARLFD